MRLPKGSVNHTLKRSKGGKRHEMENLLEQSERTVTPNETYHKLIQTATRRMKRKKKND